jgi:hypothetical protein
MRQTYERRHSWRRAFYSLGVCASLGLTGCQVDVGGQTLPSPYYQADDIQYFPPGPEFKLSREAAAQKAFKESQALEEQ